jgi:putative molybdopterin biosynthesis protein
MGIAAAADALQLDFIPLYTERYELLIPEEHYSSLVLQPLLDLLHADSFANSINSLPGYSTDHLGQILAEL